MGFFSIQKQVLGLPIELQQRKVLDIEKIRMSQTINPRSVEETNEDNEYRWNPYCDILKKLDVIEEIDRYRNKKR
jgi:hypothetical protein